MQKLFLDYTPENEIILDGEEARHIAKSLRMKVGDMLTVTDGNGNDFGCQIETVTKDTVTLKVCYRQVVTIMSCEFESHFLHEERIFAEIAQLVEHNLAKVRVASSSLVFRSHK